MGRDSGPGDYRHSVVSRAASDAFREGWERTFARKKKRQRNYEEEQARKAEMVQRLFDEDKWP